MSLRGRDAACEIPLSLQSAERTLSPLQRVAWCGGPIRTDRRGLAASLCRDAVLTTSDPDRALIERAQKELPYGTASYDELVRRYSSRVYGRAYKILRSEGDAQEASQDVFLAVYRTLPKFRFDKPFSHWISTVTLNACRMILRRRSQEQRRRDAFGREPEPQSARPDTDVALRTLVLELLDELDPGTRMPLLMRFVEGYTYAEVASELEISESAAKMRVSRGAKKLRELYEARTGEGRAKSESGDG